VKPNETTATPSRPPRSPTRRVFRWCGRGTLLVGGLLLYAFLHVNQIGLPDFVKRPLLEQLRERGAELDFSRMRVRLGRGIVIEHVNLARVREAAGEQVFAEQLQLKLRWADLLGLHAPTITAVTVHGGRLTIPVATGTNAAPFRFAVENVDARLRFVSAESWDLERFEGTCHGGAFRAAGSVTNVFRVRHPSKPSAPSDAWKQVLLRFGRSLDRMSFPQPPVLEIAFHADLADSAKSTAELGLTAGGGQSEYGRFGRLKLAAELNQPPTTNGLLRVTLRLDLQGAKTPWAEVESLRLDADFDQSPTNTLPRRIAWNLNLVAPQTRWAHADAARLSGTSAATNAATPDTYVTAVAFGGTNVVNDWASVSHLNFTANATHSVIGLLTNRTPSALTWKSSLDRVHTRWADVAALSLSGQAEHVDNPVLARDSLPPWLRFLPDWRLGTEIALTNLVSPKLELSHATTGLQWSGERLEIAHLHAALYGGELAAEASVSAATRAIMAKAATSFDVHRVSPLLGPATEKWLAQFGWPAERPALVEATAGAVLPAWTNRAPDWKTEVVPTLTLAGVARATNFSYRGLPGDTAFVPFSHTNGVWTLLGARVTRPEGGLEFDLTERVATQEYHFRIHSTLDPMVAAPLLGPGVRQVMNSFQFTRPPELKGDLWGRWHEPERTGLRASLSATNFVARGEPVTDLRVSEVTYTNRWLQVTDATVRQGTNTGQVAALGFDLAANRLHFTNTISTLDPSHVTRVIGPRTARALEPYQFAVPPHVVLNGTIPTRDSLQDADVRFETRAEAVRWWKLATTNFATTVWWRGQTVTLTNLDTGFHGGRLTGNVFVDFADPTDTSFRFDAAFQDVQLRGLLADMVPRTNRLDGLIGGRLTINEAHTRTNLPWLGGGEVRLRDGFLWDLPLFGGLSSALDKIAPGVGQTRFSSGKANFAITNRLISTRDLEFRSPAMRLACEGTVGFDTQLEATMRAEILRDVPVLGPIVSLALSPFSKLFEYQVRGALAKPVTELRYVPELLLAPLRPFETIKSLLPGETEKTKGETKPAPSGP
jgi:AsmA-like C-terminal region